MPSPGRRADSAGRQEVDFPLKKIFQFLFVILGCLHLAGGPYPLIQGYAWVTMLANYSQDGGIVQAARDTFSGEKPCGLCTKIASIRESDHRGNPQPLAPSGSTLTSKLLQEMVPASIIGAKPPQGRELAVLAFTAPLSARPQAPAAPPVPPPRATV